jgi:ParB-like chromosome segregation protein Spo0J
MSKMIIETRKISELKFAEYNPRTISKKQFKDLKASLKKFGLIDPIIINSSKDRHNIIIGGHQRSRAWLDLGNDTIPCVILDLPINDEMELNLRLNKNGGKFDDDLLLNYFDEELLFDVGFSVNDLNINLDKYEDNALEDATKDVCECCGSTI